MSRYPFFKESAHAHRWLDPLAVTGRGIEIGGSAHNDFFIKNMINIDYTASMNTIYKKQEIDFCGRAMKVDVEAFADDLPFENSCYDFLLNSHVFEHMPNPIKCLREWHRVLKRGGIIYSVIPHRDANPADADRPVTSLGHQVRDYLMHHNMDTHEFRGDERSGHYHIYTIDSYIGLIWLVNDMFESRMFEMRDIVSTDDKVGNGSVFVLEVLK